METQEANEHSKGSESDEDDEEPGTQYSLCYTFNEARAGARVVLSYDPLRRDEC